MQRAIGKSIAVCIPIVCIIPAYLTQRMIRVGPPKILSPAELFRGKMASRKSGLAAQVETAIAFGCWREATFVRAPLKESSHETSPICFDSNDLPLRIHLGYG